MAISRQARRQRQRKTIENLPKGFKYTEIDESYQFVKDKTARLTMLKAQYKKLAKQADQRLVRLEKLAKSDAEFRNVLKYGYANAMADIQRFFGDKATRFNKTLQGLNERQIEARINAVLDFINAVSSTKKGIKEVYKNRKNKIEEKYNISWEDALNLFERGLITKYAEAGFSSDLILKVVAKQKADKKSFDKFISENIGKDIRTQKDSEGLIKYMRNLKRQGRLSTEELLLYINE